MSDLPTKLTDISVIDWDDRDGFYHARGAWQDWVRCDVQLSSTARCAAWEISDRMNADKSGAWPSQGYVAARLGCSERSARSAIKELFERGWLLAQRGRLTPEDSEKVKAGARDSYTYIMAASPTVLRAVLEAERDRVSDFREERAKEDRTLRLDRQKVAGLLLTSRPEENCRSDRKKLAGPTGSFLPVQPEENCRVICTENLSTESVQGTDQDKRLGETETEESPRETLRPSPSPSPAPPARTVPALVDDEDDEAKQLIRVRGLVIRELGEGDRDRGRELVAFLDEARLSEIIAIYRSHGARDAFQPIADARQSAQRQMKQSRQKEVA